MNIKTEVIKLLRAGNKLNIHDCSLCGYPCGYLSDGDNLFYDSGCYCVSYSPNVRGRSWHELDDYFNQPGWQITLSDFITTNKGNNMTTFSEALEAMKHGKRAARAGWNGKDMWICKGEGNPALEAEKFWNVHTRTFAENNGGSAPVLPYMIMKTANGEILMGWLASQTDMLADDWQILEDQLQIAA